MLVLLKNNKDSKVLGNQARGHMFKSIFSVALMALFLSSCSVAMAAKKSGHSIEQVQTATTRMQMQNLALKVLSTEKDAQGHIVETYQIEKSRGSAARAIMHGVLDLSTCFLWEIAGTPIEVGMNKKETFAVRVTYAADDNRVEKVELA